VKRIVDTARVSGTRWTASLILDRLVPFGVRGRWPEWTVSPELLERQLHLILGAWGMSREHASTTVDQILYADLHGIDSHGCAMLLHYARRMSAGALTATPRVEVVLERETTAVVDGGGGLGHVPAAEAMALAIAKCREVGLAAVAVRNSAHFGAAGGYAALAAAAGLIGIATTNTEDPAVVPTFGAEAMLGTNAFAFAAPGAPGRPFLLDMSTSTVSLGTVATAWRRGRRIPAGWAVDARGRPVRNARVATEQRRLTPLGSTRAMGSHKGYGLAAMVEVLSSILPAADGVGHFLLALDPRAFRGGERGPFEHELAELMDSLRASEPIDARRPVLVAGDPERAVAAERRRSGIPLSRSVVEDIRGIARASRVQFVLDGGG
jgi:LDH2 family malate/lactate/ureidoglycolate dehydrogenase